MVDNRAWLGMWRLIWTLVSYRQAFIHEWLLIVLPNRSTIKLVATGLTSRHKWTENMVTNHVTKGGDSSSVSPVQRCPILVTLPRFGRFHRDNEQEYIRQEWLRNCALLQLINQNRCRIVAQALVPFEELALVNKEIQLKARVSVRRGHISRLSDFNSYSTSYDSELCL